MDSGLCLIEEVARREANERRRAMAGERAPEVKCVICGNPVQDPVLGLHSGVGDRDWPDDALCDGCWEVKSRLDGFLNHKAGIKLVMRKILEKIETRKGWPA